MSYLALRAPHTLLTPSAARRRKLLTAVIAGHVAIGALLMTAKTVAPQLLDNPLFVDMIAPTEPPKRIVEPHPQPAPKTPTPLPKTTQPPIETTTSAAPAPAAISAPPAPPVPAAEPVTQARFDADYLKNPAPAYPAVSRRRGEEGRVVLHVQVSPQGTAEQIDIRTSSGSPRLDDAAVSTVRHWRFVPARRGDTAVSSWVFIPIVFKLEQ